MHWSNGIQWTSRLCETCKNWIKDENECPYQGNLDRTDKYGNDMFVTACAWYEEGEPCHRCSNCKHWGAELRPCDKCYNQDEWEAKDENNS